MFFNNARLRGSKGNNRAAALFWAVLLQFPFICVSSP